MLVFFNFVFQFSSIFCSVLAQTVEEPFFYASIKIFYARARVSMLKWAKSNNGLRAVDGGG